MNEITVFKNAKETKTPHFTSVDFMLERIRKCTVQKTIDLLHSEKDKKRKAEIKQSLPVICFSGKFTQRAIKHCAMHSGFAILDFDHVENLQEKKNKMMSYDFVYSVFISPSGDGLKVLVRIPADIEKHSGYYKGLEKMFPDLDSANRDISRACFESCDKDIYINANAIEFTDYIEVLDATINNSVVIQNTENNYSKAEQACKIIRNSIAGSFHQDLLRASRLMGGFIAGGLIDESMAISMIENEIKKKPINDFEAARVTIQKGINHGINSPIQEEEAIRKEYVSQAVGTVRADDEDYSFLATDEECDLYITQKRNGTFKMGNKTGFPSFYKYFRFNKGQLDMVLGHDNAGKSIISWYFSMLDCVFNDEKYIIFAGENKTGAVKSRIIEFYTGKSIVNLTESEFTRANKWFKEHYALIRNDEIYSYLDMLNIGRKMLRLKNYTKFIIEPYNVLNKPSTNEHQYDYKAMIDIRMFILETGIGVLLNVHAATEALRKVYSKEHEWAGYAMPPNKSDAEGGGKFPNKADNFIVIHRMADHPTEKIWTEIHVQKIKEYETGGQRTNKYEPYKIRMIEGGCGFIDENGFDPIAEYWSKQGTPIKLTENQNFLNELKPLVQAEEKEYEPFPF